MHGGAKLFRLIVSYITPELRRFGIFQALHQMIDEFACQCLQLAVIDWFSSLIARPFTFLKEGFLLTLKGRNGCYWDAAKERSKSDANDPRLL